MSTSTENLNSDGYLNTKPALAQDI